MVKDFFDNGRPDDPERLRKKLATTIPNTAWFECTLTTVAFRWVQFWRFRVSNSRSPLLPDRISNHLAQTSYQMPLMTLAASRSNSLLRRYGPLLGRSNNGPDLVSTTKSVERRPREGSFGERSAKAMGAPEGVRRSHSAVRLPWVPLTAEELIARRVRWMRGAGSRHLHRCHVRQELFRDAGVIKRAAA
jgi:hypothetical protein